MQEDVIFTEESGYGIITLNRPKSLNALTLEMVNAITERLQTWMQSDLIIGVLIRATPGKVFCAGGDIRLLYEQGIKQNPQQMNFFTAEYNLNRLIYHYPKPYIALIDGLNFGGGIGITLHGSYKIATQQSIFAMPETAIGFFPDVGSSHLLSRLSAIGLYLGLLGDRIDARIAKNLGLIDKVVPDEFAERDLSAIIQWYVHNSPSPSSSELLENEYRIPHQDEIEQCFNASEVEIIIENLKKYKTEWSQKVQEELALKSPLSLKITCEQLKRAKSFSFDECIAMDAVLVKHFMLASDFYEGVRAMLIDKDKTPRWQPNTLNQVTTEMVDSYFR